MAIVNGTPGDDNNLVTTIGDDIIYGFAGADYILADGQNNTPNGGNDVILAGDGNDIVYAYVGDDELQGGSGNDQLFAGAGWDLVIGGLGDDVMRGEAGNDRLLGEDGNDQVFAGSGNDTVDGGLGNDLLYGSTGNDSINGGLGNDSLYGEDGNDILLGDDGDDLVVGGFGSDFLSAGLGLGNDTIESHTANVSDFVVEIDLMYGGLGADTFRLRTDYLGSTGSLDPLIDRSHASIEDFVQGEDILDMKYGSGYTINYRNYLAPGTAVRDTVISYQGDLVAIVKDVELSITDLT